MTRVKSKSQIKHRKIRKLAKGFKHARSRRFGAANEAVMHAGQYAYEGRKLRKRDLRSLWITRINAALRMENVSYSKFIDLLKKAKIELDRKILSDIASKDPDTFTKILQEVQ
jgi:large subunit ribosomal protein L20